MLPWIRHQLPAVETTTVYLYLYMKCIRALRSLSAMHTGTEGLYQFSTLHLQDFFKIFYYCEESLSLVHDCTQIFGCNLDSREWEYVVVYENMCSIAKTLNNCFGDQQAHTHTLNAHLISHIQPTTWSYSQPEPITCSYSQPKPISWSYSYRTNHMQLLTARSNHLQLPTARTNHMQLLIPNQSHAVTHSQNQSHAITHSPNQSHAVTHAEPIMQLLIPNQSHAVTHAEPITCSYSCRTKHTQFYTHHAHTDIEATFIHCN